MLFSKHNENITYINHYSGLLEVKGKGVLSLEDTELLYEQGKNWAKEYDTLSVTEGITGLGEGYIEFFSHIDCLILSRTVGTLAASPELLKGWRKRKVLICGEYDGMVFIVGPERMSKCRFIIKSLLPGFVLGVIPYISFLINPELRILGLLGALGIASSAGDYYNVYNALRQMPKGARAYMHKYNTFWYIPDSKRFD